MDVESYVHRWIIVFLNVAPNDAVSLAETDSIESAWWKLRVASIHLEGDPPIF